MLPNLAVRILIFLDSLQWPQPSKVFTLQFHFVVIKDLVERNSWPGLVPELKIVIQKSISIDGCGLEWNTVNTLEVLKSIVKPFQVCLRGLHSYCSP